MQGVWGWERKVTQSTRSSHKCTKECLVFRATFVVTASCCVTQLICTLLFTLLSKHTGQGVQWEQLSGKLWKPTRKGKGERQGEGQETHYTNWSSQTRSQLWRCIVVYVLTVSALQKECSSLQKYYRLGYFQRCNIKWKLDAWKLNDVHI